MAIFLSAGHGLERVNNYHCFERILSVTQDYTAD